MRRFLLLGGAFVAAVLGALWYLGVFDRDLPAPAPPPHSTERSSAPPVELGAQEPTDEPPADVPVLDAPIRVLVIGESTRSFFSWCTELWDGTPQVEWQTWYERPPADGATTHSRSLPALDHAPTAADLDECQVLYLAAPDPARYPAGFWARVAERVRDGRLGLIVVPDHLHGKALADEPSLRTVLPVTGVLPMKAVAPAGPGGAAAIPGVFETPRPFTVTAEGTRHPATRLVAFPGWSEKIWARHTRGEAAWGTKFVSPVSGVSPDATVLVKVDGGDSTWPAFVASGGEHGRSLWVGGVLDIDWAVYRSGKSFEHLRSMAISWLAWLAPSR